MTNQPASAMWFFRYTDTSAHTHTHTHTRLLTHIRMSMCKHQIIQIVLCVSACAFVFIIWFNKIILDSINKTYSFSLTDLNVTCKCILHEKVKLTKYFCLNTLKQGPEVSSPSVRYIMYKYVGFTKD